MFSKYYGSTRRTMATRTVGPCHRRLLISTPTFYIAFSRYANYLTNSVQTHYAIFDNSNNYLINSNMDFSCHTFCSTNKITDYMAGIGDMMLWFRCNIGATNHLAMHLHRECGMLHYPVVALTTTTWTLLCAGCLCMLVCKFVWEQNTFFKYSVLVH